MAVSTTALVLMLILDQARSRFKKALDRRFSRDKSQLDRTLQQMSQAVQQLVDPPALAQRLLQATTELMGVARGSVFLRQGDPPLYRLQGSLRADAVSGRTFVRLSVDRGPQGRQRRQLASAQHARTDAGPAAAPAHRRRDRPSVGP